MPAAPRVVINCAGEGRRLGIGKTKALVSVLGRPLIAWHLDMLRDVEDIVVVVGYQSHEVLDFVAGRRRDVVFAFNRHYATTGTASSLALGCDGARGDVISLDGDLLVDPRDFATFLADERPCLGIAPPTTSEAVLVSVSGDGDRRAATGFSRDGDGPEWTGLFRAPAEIVLEAHDERRTNGHVFEMLAAHLPLAVRDVAASEIDTPADYDRTVAWLEPRAHLWAAA